MQNSKKQPNWENVRKAMYFKEVAAAREGIRVLTLEEKRKLYERPKEHCPLTIDLFDGQN